MANKTNSSINSIYFKNSFMKKEGFESKKEDSKYLSNIINCLVQTNNIVEFNSNAGFYDSKQKILTPTIAENYATDGRKATLISPNFHGGFKNNDLTIVRCNIDNPFGEYQYLITPKMKRKIEEAECFVVSDNIPGLDKRFKAWAGMGIPCIYTMTGSIDPKTKEMDPITMKKDKEIKRFMDSLTIGNNLTTDESSDQISKKNNIYKIYVLKR